MATAALSTAAQPCLVCGHRGWEPHCEILLRCRGCAFVTADLCAPLDATALYDEAYFRGAEYLDYAADEAFMKRNFAARLRTVLRYQNGGRLLEIGAAYGFFLDLARTRFTCVGYEVCAAAARSARESLGLDVRCDDFLAGALPDLGGPIDVAVLWDVIEHLEHPDRVIARVAALSRPGALLVLTTGDIGSWLARWRGRRWRLIHPPTHLHYFSRPTITRLLARHGYRVRAIRAIPVARSLQQVAYAILALRMGRPRWYARLARTLPASWGFSLSTFDIMEVVAERATETTIPAAAQRTSSAPSARP